MYLYLADVTTSDQQAHAQYCHSRPGFNWTSDLSIIECSHGYDAQTKFKFIVHVDIYDERMGKAAGRVFRERQRVFADFEQEDGGVSTTS